MANEPENPNLERRKLFTTALLGVAALSAASKLSAAGPASSAEDHESVDDPTDLKTLRNELTDLPPDPVVPQKPGLAKNLLAPKVAPSRTPAGESVWKTVEGKLPGLLPPAAQTPAAGAPPIGSTVAKPDQFFRLGRTFNFAPLTVDQELNPLHPEFLLDQASDLLDRSLRDRAAWDEMNAKQFQLALELNEYRDLDRIHQQEIKEGIYTVPAVEAVAEEDGLARHLTSARIAAELTTKVLAEFYSDEVVATYTARSSLLSRLGAMPAYYFKEQKFSKFNEVKIDGKTKPIYTHAQNAAGYVADINVRVEKLSTLIQQSLNQAAADYTESKHRGAAVRAEWETKNVWFASERTATNRKYQDIKARAAVSPWGPVNYSEQMAALQKRFEYDFREALARMQVAAIGLAQVYGYNEPRPVPDAEYDYYDECLLWVRRAVQFLIRRSRSESNTVLPVSVRGLLSALEWQAFLQSRSFSVKLGPTQFPGMSEVRLRGLSASFASTPTGPAMLSARVDPPAAASFQRLNGVLDSYAQPRVKPCVIGRIYELRAARPSDVVGAQVLFNASPWGDWRITIPPGTKLEGLDDLVLEFQVAYRPQP